MYNISYLIFTKLWLFCHGLGKNGYWLYKRSAEIKSVHKYCNNKTYNSGKTLPQIWHFLSPDGSMIKCLILYISSIPSEDVVYNKNMKND